MNNYGVFWLITGGEKKVSKCLSKKTSFEPKGKIIHLIYHIYIEKLSLESLTLKN